ncbi:DNA mismatch repair endonuclease MutH [Methylophaga frappieri]|nr:DNA mismatch repair endonuclease MutH [Methylophaga frappieri]
MSDQIFVPRVPPASESELMERCRAISGKTLGQLAASADVVVPKDLRRHKGWVGGFLESLLGADAGTSARPDFTQLGIELKTLPLAATGMPKESTYVCTVDMSEYGEMPWEQSWLRRKLAKVLWLPVEGVSAVPLIDRYVGMGFLWSPDSQQAALLRQDWEELMEMLLTVGPESVTARQGEVLQIRPKAANSRMQVAGLTMDGEQTQINPRGFYLRPAFTKAILDSNKACR